MSTTADGDIPTACFLGFQACQQHNSEHKPDHCCHFLSHWTPVHFSYIAAGGGGVAAAAAGTSYHLSWAGVAAQPHHHQHIPKHLGEKKAFAYDAAPSIAFPTDVPAKQDDFAVDVVAAGNIAAVDDAVGTVDAVVVAKVESMTGLAPVAAEYAALHAASSGVLVPATFAAGLEVQIAAKAQTAPVGAAAAV